jgi:type IV pilus assembly protein PilC
MSTVYSYTARSAKGAVVAGSLSATTREHALAHLRTRALFVTSLHEFSSLRGRCAHPLLLVPAPARERVTFTRALAALLSAGVPLRRALEIAMTGCRSNRLREALASVAADVESGAPLSAAMEKRPNEFSGLTVAMARAGEASGSLERSLERLATLMERQRAAKKRLESALAYPAVVLTAATALILFLVSNTIPAFAGLFAQMHATLPLSTRMLLAIGGALEYPATYGALICILACMAAAFTVIRGNPDGALALDALRLRLPILGGLLRKAAIARVTRTLSTLLEGAVPIMSALMVSADVAASPTYVRAVRGVAESLRRGASLSAALRGTALGEEVVVALVSVGEETGSLDAMLLRVAEYYDLEVETAMSALGSIVEPLVILALGAIVGTIVASILIPLYSMIGSIK